MCIYDTCGPLSSDVRPQTLEMTVVVCWFFSCNPTLGIEMVTGFFEGELVDWAGGMRGVFTRWLDL
jgi:hypothetical protein